MFRTVSTSTAALVLGAAGALADVTPDQVWDNIRTSYEDMGYDVAVGAEEAGEGRLGLRDITVSSDPESSGSVRLTIPALVLEQQGADVRSTIEGSMTLAVREEISEGEIDAEGNQPRHEVGFDATIDAPGNSIVTSGTPEDLTHSVEMPELTVDGRPIEGEDEGLLRMGLTDLKATQRTRRTADAPTEHEFGGTAATMTAAIEGVGPAPEADMPEAEPEAEAPDAQAPETGAPETGAADNAAPDTETAETQPTAQPTERFRADLTASDLAFEGKGTQPEGVEGFDSDPVGALAAGFAMDISVTAAAMGLNFSADAHDAATGTPVASRGAMEAVEGRLTLGLDADAFSYGVGAGEARYSLTSDQLPFPIEYSIASSDFSLEMPVTARTEPQPYALALAVEGITLGEQIWAGLDPEGTLPRDPAALNVDIAGQAMVADDLMAPAEDKTDGGPPFYPTTLDLRRIALRAAGAAADLTGQLEFRDDPRAPVGLIEGRFEGINGLMDKLVQMGLLPQDRVMAARMMMAMFARPVEGAEDTLETELKFTEAGEIFANGQQVK